MEPPVQDYTQRGLQRTAYEWFRSRGSAKSGISWRAFEAMLKDLNLDFSEEQIKELFEYADKDGDKLISFDEFLWATDESIDSAEEIPEKLEEIDGSVKNEAGYSDVKDNKNRF